MRIVDVRAYPLRAEVSRAYGGALGMSRERTPCLVEVVTDQGLSGWGEGGTGRGQQVVASVVEQQLRPLLVGEDSANLNRLWEKMYGALVGSGRTAGLSLQAVSAVDIALWDLRGKETGLPVYELLGGKVRDTVMAYATGLYYYEGQDPCSGLAEEALGYLERGFRGMKLKIGMETVATDVRRVQIVREAIGPDCLLMIDANQAYGVSTARELGRRVADLDLAWFEEPIPAHDLQGYLELKAALPMPLAAGECLYTRFGFRDWCARRALDVAQPDVTIAGGLTEGRRIAALTSTWGILNCPHAWGTPVMISASLHLAVTLPPLAHTRGQFPLVQQPVLELDQGEDPFQEALTPPPYTLQDGFATPGTKPGLGIEIDRDALRRFLAG